jgi:hypothetical protein
LVSKNFFIAKKGDSESAERVFELGERVASASMMRAACRVRIKEMPVAQAFLAMFVNKSVGFFRTTCIVVQKLRRLQSRRALRGLPLLRQHFFKLDAVFFGVLVYSGDSAFRFPSARSD